ncbi:hypothetical protein L484_016182 [Morus notabilis]|uniref:Uncharacterized protein n=1 Tax=Morus notabilis TaxID=981085 RepID=W9RHJ9_9ROSA|nr:hypothetical protein L484_016182 [Morus notabilis]
MSHSHVELEQGQGHQTNHHRSIGGSDVSADGSVCFSDADEGSCYSQFFSTTGGSYDEYSFRFVCDPQAGISHASGRVSSAASDCSVRVEVEAEMGFLRLSHEYGVPIELGCSCKDDLGSALKNYAKVWFKIKGNK